jgi:hypothetical protein
VLPALVGVVLLVGLLVAFAALSWRRGRVGRGLAVSFGTIVGSGAVSWLALAAINVVRPGMFWRAEPVWTHLATYASAILVGVALLATLGSQADRTQLRSAFWLAFLLLGGAIGLLAPGGIIFFLFPPLIVLAGMVASRWWQPAERVASWIAILILYLTWGAMLALLEELLNTGPMWLFAPLGALLILPVLIEGGPMIHSAGTRAGLLVAGTLVLAGCVAAAVAPAYSADRQQRFSVEHVTDIGMGKAWWSIVNDGKPVGIAGNWKLGKLPYSDRQRWLSAAKPIEGQPAPAIDAERHDRTIRAVIHADGADAVALIAPKDADIRAAGVAGFVRPIDPAAKKDRYGFSCSGRSCDGVTLEIVAGNAKPIAFTVIGTYRRLPRDADPLLRVRPTNARPQYAPDQSIMISRMKL